MITTEVTYLTTPDRMIFLPSLEWSLIERDLSAKDRVRFSELGYPTIELKGKTYFYLPLDINNVSYMFVRGKRPILKVDNVKE